jgi:hypothetical protein
METSRKAQRLATSVCLLALAACSGGGGGGSGTSVVTTPTNTNTSSSNNTPTPPAAVTILPPNGVGVAGVGGSGTNFTTNPPSVGTSLNLNGNSIKVTGTNSVTDSGINNAITAVYRGFAPGSTTVSLFDFSVPALSITANNLRSDGTPVTVSGGTVAATFATMTYTLIGAWAYNQTGGGGYLGQVVTGYTTPGSGVPTTGTASYTGNPNTALGGGVIGAYAVPSGTGTITAGTLAGNVSLNANFAANTATGSFTSMVATPATGGGASTPWNDVNFSTTFTRSAGGVTINGSTSASAPPAGAGTTGFAAGSSGNITGFFYGPTAQEVGGNWTLTDPVGGSTGTNGKAAFGTFGAK